MIKRLIVLIVALLPLIINAQTGADFFKFDEINKETSIPQIITMYGKPSKIDTSLYGITVHYDIDVKEYYDYGWVLFLTDKEGKLENYTVKVGYKAGGTVKILDKLKTKFNLNAQLLGLFDLDYKGLAAEMKKLGITFGDPQKSGSKYAWFIDYKGTGSPRITVTIGDGKNFDDNRQKKVYSLDVYF